MQLFKKRKIVSELFAPFVESKSDFENFQKKNDPHRLCISEITDSARRG